MIAVPERLRFITLIIKGLRIGYRDLLMLSTEFVKLGHKLLALAQESLGLETITVR